VLLMMRHPVLCGEGGGWDAEYNVEEQGDTALCEQGECSNASERAQEGQCWSSVEQVWQAG
jgi:hypothetical protein